MLPAYTMFIPLAADLLEQFVSLPTVVDSTNSLRIVIIEVTLESSIPLMPPITIRCMRKGGGAISGIVIEVI